MATPSNIYEVLIPVVCDEEGEVYKFKEPVRIGTDRTCPYGRLVYSYSTEKSVTKQDPETNIFAGFTLMERLPDRQGTPCGVEVAECDLGYQVLVKEVECKLPSGYIPKEVKLNTANLYRYASLDELDTKAGDAVLIREYHAENSKGIPDYSERIPGFSEVVQDEGASYVIYRHEIPVEIGRAHV